VERIEEELQEMAGAAALARQEMARAQEMLRKAREAELLDLSDVLPGLESVMLQNREQLRMHFSGHPEVARMIEGALDAYNSAGADAFRQALASCRSALEQATFEATRERDFRTGRSSVAAGNRRRLIKDTYNFLSGYGSHPGGKATKKDVEYGIRMAIASCTWILENH
jgi:hypothetical protein